MDKHADTAFEHPGQPESHGHFHEHPHPFTPLPLVDERVFASIRAALSLEHSCENDVAQRSFDELGGLIKLLDNAISAARLYTQVGEKAASWFQTALAMIDPEHAYAKKQQQGEHGTDAGYHPGTLESGHSELPLGTLYSASPLVDLLIGLTYLYDNNQHRIDHAFKHVYSVLAHAIPVIDAAYSASVESPPLANMISQFTASALVRSDHQASQRALSFLQRATHVKNEWFNSNPIALLLDRARKIALSEVISRTATVEGVGVLVSEQQGFGDKRPSEISVYGEDGRIQYPVTSWSAGKITVLIPDLAVTGRIFFAPSQDDSVIAKEMHRWEHHVLPSEWPHTVLPILQRFGLRRVAPQKSPVIKIEHDPRIVALSVVDARGIHIDSAEKLIEAERPLELQWRLEHARSGLRVMLKTSDQIIGEYDAAIGRIPVPSPWDSPGHLKRMSLGIKAAGADGTMPPGEVPSLGDEQPVLSHKNVWRVWGPLEVNPPVIRFKVSSRQDARRAETPVARRPATLVEVRFPWPVPNPLNVIVTSDSERVTVESVNPMPARTTSFYFAVTAWAYDRDRPEQPCARISINADDERQQASYWGELEVWVEPDGGKWELVGDGSPAERIRGQRLQTVGIHAVLMHTGSMLFFSPPQGRIDDQTNVETELWEPASRTSTLLTPPASRLRNLFCAGQCNLPDGRVLVAGGHAGIGTVATDWSVHVFDPGAPEGRRWSKMDDMTEPRWYPTCTTLPDGRVLIASGSSAGPWGPVADESGVIHSSFGWAGDLIRLTDRLSVFFFPLAFAGLFAGGTATSIDIFDWRTNRLERFPAAGFLDSFADTYPYVCVLPRGPGYDQGALLVIERDRLYFFANQSDGRSPLGVQVERRLAFAARRTFPKYGGGVLLPIHATNPARVRYLVAGGGDERSQTLTRTAPATDTLEIIDFNPSLPLPSQPAPSVFRTRRMHHRRFMNDTVLMADGNVLICGGAARGITNINDTPVRQAEIFDVDTETLRLADTAQIERRYHSTHVLLLDGTIQATGSTGGYPPQEPEPQFQVEVYRPGYLWRGSRPRIANAPAIIPYGTSITITTPDSARIANAALIRLASVTHANNMDQRYVILPVTGVESSSPARPTDHIIVATPRDGTIAPPGPYMLVLVDRVAVPSYGQVVFVR